MAEGKTSWIFDLDIKEFTEKTLKAKGMVESLGDSKNLEGLVDGLLKASKIIGIVGTAALALKTAFDAVFEAEQIKTINAQFEKLAENAGLAGSVMKEKLIGAAGGMAGETEVLKRANEEIIKLGGNAAKLPEILELSRKHAKVFGGDFLEIMDRVSTAVATGNSRQLRSLGIIIDQEKAIRAYAVAHGKTVDVLSQEERGRAILNATLEKSHKLMDGIDGSTKKATTGWKQLGVTLNEVKDIIVLALDRTFGPAVKRIIDNMNVLANVTREYFRDNFGSEVDQARAKSKKLADQINGLNDRINEMKLAAKEGTKFLGMHFKANIPPEVIEKLEKQRDLLREQRQEIEATIAAKSEEKTTEKVVEPEEDLDAMAAKKTKFEQDILSAKQSRIDSELALNASLTGNEFDLFGQTKMLLDQRTTEEQLTQEKIKMLHEEAHEYKMGLFAQEKKGLMDHSTAVALAEQKDLDTKAKAAELEQKLNAKKVADRKATLSMIAGLQKSNNSALAMAGKAAGITQIAIEPPVAISKALSAFPPPFSFIAAGLVAAAMAEQAASIAGVDTGGGGAGGGGGSAPGGFSVPAAGSGEAGAAPALQEQPKKSVTIQVMGHYFETEQTKTKLMDMMREATDATDFAYKQIGQS